MAPDCTNEGVGSKVKEAQNATTERRNMMQCQTFVETKRQLGYARTKIASVHIPNWGRSAKPDGLRYPVPYVPRERCCCVGSRVVQC